MIFSKFKVAAFVFFTFASLANAGPADPQAADDRTANVSQQQRAFLTNFARVSPRSSAAWPGFDIRQIPILIVFRDAAGDPVRALALNHPNPPALGQSVNVGPLTDGSRASEITNLKFQNELKKIENFVFSLELGGAPTFVLSLDQESVYIFLQTDRTEFIAYVFHESFHRHQLDNFENAHDDDSQEADDFSEENIYLSRLEDLILLETKDARSTSELEILGAELVALREKRRARDVRVAIDDHQERIEGTARYLEAFLVGDMGATYNLNNLHHDLEVELAEIGIKEYFGFGRFYSSGAMVIHLLDRLGARGHKEAIAAGKSPMDALRDELRSRGISANVETVIRRLDPHGSLHRQAEEWARVAENEPDIFADERT